MPGCFTAALLLLSLACLAGCDSPSPRREPVAKTAAIATGSGGFPAPATARQLLVTFHQQAHLNSMPFGPRRSYRGHDLWSASLHVRARIADVAEEYNLKELDGWPIASLNLYCVVFSLPPGRDMSQLLESLNSDQRVSFAQPMNQFQGMLIQRYDDPLFDIQYGQHKASVERLHTLTQGKNVRIGIVDSMVDIEHPDLKGQIDSIHNFVDDSGITTDRAGGEKNAGGMHGTAVAGVIAAAANNSEGVVGLAPGASLFIYGACNEVENLTRCTSFSLAKAIERAIEDHINILNLSLAGPYDPLLKALIDKAQQQSMIIIAAENLGDPNMNFPAMLENVYPVGSSRSAAFWFSRNEQLSTQAGGGYRFFHGTSIATAGVTGIAALLYSLEPVPRINDILTQLVQGECIRFTPPSGMLLDENLQKNNCTATFE